MKKNIVAGILAVVFIATAATAAPVSALTIDELQTQIKELLAKLTSLQLQLRTTVATQTPPVDPTTTSTPNKHRICNILARNLSQGTRGDDVRGLQEFLSAEGYLSASATGYFGPMTAQAVAKWQASEGVSAVGSVGPMSRERIKVWCGDKARFAAEPKRGPAPLSVTFKAMVGGFTLNQYFIDFGDGSARAQISCSAPADFCVRPGTVDHTYTRDGVYTAVLYEYNPGGCGPNADPRCLGAPARESVLAKEQIHVGAVACTKEYAPVCGSKPIVCITTPCNPIPQTYGNRCTMNADGATYLYEGVCRNDSGNKSPTISSFSGPTSLAINASGTWTIQASDPEGGSLNYAITWGDEYRTVPPYASAAARENFVQTTTFTHAYAAAGTYTVSIVVSDASGAQAKTSSTVRVGEPQPVACTMDAMQCPDGSWVGRTGPNCQFVCPN